MEEHQGYYVVIPTIVFEDKNLKDSSKLLYGLISTLINKNGYCYAGNEYLANKRKTTPQNISRLLKELEERKYIIIEYLRDGAIVKNRKIYLNSRLTEMLTAINRNVNGTVNRNVKESNITSITKVIHISNKAIISRVVAKLNELAGTNYQPTTKNTIDLINGRLADGYTEQDLTTVVEKMCYLWSQKPNQRDKDMRQFLRPSTLFRARNFENYLNRPVTQRELTTGDLHIDISDF